MSDPRPLSQSEPLDPPHTVADTLRRLGPGLIIAGSIVGSGELIGTTKTGAEAGFWLLWLVLVGCVIKVFAQIEFGRYTLVTGQTTMSGLNEVPGPRLRVNWIVWYWFIMFLLTTGQLGGIMGGVGQAMAISLPITGDFRAALDSPADARPASAALSGTKDDVIWCAIITVVTAILLVRGRYRLIEHFSTFLVASFTAVTMFCLVAQQMTDAWAVHWSDIAQGLSFRLPPDMPGATPLVTALATFGIIGVGANELLAYPYWCLEKGYAAFTGPRDSSSAWADRARGWMRVMRWDAWCSMVIYTFATVGFYLLGAGVLHRQGLNPESHRMIRTLASMYEPTFGVWAETIFLFGAFAVLYSTLFVAVASHARVAADTLRVSRLGASTPESQRAWVKLLCVVLLLAAFVIYSLNKDPVTLVLIGGLSQALMLPVLGVAALFFRFRRGDARVKPGRLWDAMLVLSVLGLTITGTWTAWTNLEKLKALVARIFGVDG